MVHEPTDADPEPVAATLDDNILLVEVLRSGIASGRWERDSVLPGLNTQHFEKDIDDNGHIDFVYASSNLRAAMYSIDVIDDWYEVKRMAGRITPAIATTTGCVSGLVCIELIKYVQELSKINASIADSPDAAQVLGRFRNAFLSLAEPCKHLSIGLR